MRERRVQQEQAGVQMSETAKRARSRAVETRVEMLEMLNAAMELVNHDGNRRGGCHPCSTECSPGCGQPVMLLSWPRAKPCILHCETLILLGSRGVQV